MKISDLKDYHVVASAPPTPTRSTVKDLAIGAAKGVGDTAMGLVKLGRATQAALDPTQTLQDINKKYAGTDARFDEALKSDNPTQKFGKGIEFVAEVLFPTSVATKGTKVAGAVFEKLGSRISSIPDEAVEGGIKIKDRLIDLVSSLDDKTKTALQRTPKDIFDRVVDQGKKAMLDDRNRTPLETVGDDIIDALNQVKNRADQAGQAKSQIMQQAKIGFTKAGNIAQRTALEIQKAFSGKQLDTSDTKIIQSFQAKLKALGDNPSLREIDATIDLLQDQLYKVGRSNVLEVTDRVTGILRRQLGKLNSQVKDLGGESYARLNDEYADLIQTTTELNARLGKEGSSAGAFVKRLFSPSDARTKELFKKLEKLTGKDFFRDARLAKFVMDVLGDTRGQSLLEQIPTSPSSAVEKIIDYGIKKLTDPLKEAERFLKK